MFYHKNDCFIWKVHSSPACGVIQSYVMTVIRLLLKYTNGNVNDGQKSYMNQILLKGKRISGYNFEHLVAC